MEPSPTPWASLPNAIHIDNILNLSRNYPILWSTAYVIDGSHSKAWNTVRLKSDADLLIKIGQAVQQATPLNSNITTRYLVWGTLAALAVWEQSSEYLSMSSDELTVWSILSGDPAAILVVSAVAAMEKIKALENILVDNKSVSRYN